MLLRMRREVTIQTARRTTIAGIPAAGFARVVQVVLPPSKSEGAGKAGCQPHPKAPYVKGSETYELHSPTG
jgi:hypothetical protein